MPEMPEVETVRQTLKKQIIGKTISDIKVLYPKMLLNPTDVFISSLKGRKLLDIDRRGKYLIFIFDNEVAMISHLRMEGKYFLKPESAEIAKHEHVVFYFSDGLSLRYHDTRKFGRMEVKPVKDIYVTPPISLLGLDANQVTKESLKAHIKGHALLKSFLLKQEDIAGIGNIYADEICFKAHLNPKEDVLNLTDEDLENIVLASHEIINEAIKAGGTTIRSYTSSLGVTGLFQLKLMVHTKKGLPCPLCGHEIVKEVVAGRGTYFCPTCQKLKK